MWVNKRKFNEKEQVYVICYLLVKMCLSSDFLATWQFVSERDCDSQVARFLILSVCVRVIVMNVPLEECVKTGDWLVWREQIH